mgnify:CR=1 FL=1
MELTKEYLDSIFEDIDIRGNGYAIGGKSQKGVKIFLYIGQWETLHFNRMECTNICKMFDISYDDVREIIEEYIIENFLDEDDVISFFQPDL